MADWRDVMGARSDADAALASVETLAGLIQDGRRSSNEYALALLLVGAALCYELRALGVTHDYGADCVRV